MGGVDVHDQLAFKLKKYFKSPFLGLLDLALVNANIVYCRVAASQGRDVPSGDFLVDLQKQLLAAGDADFVDLAPPTLPHLLDSGDDGHNIRSAPTSR